jgi:hypothetical protein
VVGAGGTGVIDAAAPDNAVHCPGLPTNTTTTTSAASSLAPVHLVHHLRRHAPADHVVYHVREGGGDKSRLSTAGMAGRTSITDAGHSSHQISASNALVVLRAAAQVIAIHDKQSTRRHGTSIATHALATQSKLWIGALAAPGQRSAVLHVRELILVESVLTHISADDLVSE